MGSVMVFSLICERPYYSVVVDKILILYVVGNLTLETSRLGLLLLELLRLIPLLGIRLLGFMISVFYYYR